ncbi:cytochrome c oxidase assembly protein COX14 homolog [Sinocyclocheilus rhinocerous]|uniref:cytochrome c oxidase assembly protein COX14 homolog n=1 Tax=Sinocyclocheilus rhinocerous TaxID=307959 RepID=UPI0007B7DA22|nr:PREDICTED: cytochrome c oxidase assembly protein COX14 homolog [Sinocyclocheilus rhinocerous]
MLSGKRIADVGYKLFSGSMMLLTVYGGYLCVLRAQRYMQRQKQLELAAQNESAASETIKTEDTGCK